MPRKVTIGYLPNGVQVNCFSDKNSNVAEIGCNVGAVDSPKGKTGLWHLCEHLISRQTRSKDVNEVELAMVRYAGWCDTLPSDLNIEIHEELLRFGHGSLTRPYFMYPLMRIIAEGFRDRYFTVDGIMSEKGAIHPEILALGDDDVCDYGERLLRRLIYKRNPIIKRVDGEVDELEKIKYPNQLLREADKFLIPQRTWVNIFGPSHVDSIKFANEILGKWRVDGAQEVEWQADRQVKKPVRMPRRVDGYDGGDNSPLLRSVVESIEWGKKIKSWHMLIGFPIPEILWKYEEAMSIIAAIAAFKTLKVCRTANKDYLRGVYRVKPSVVITFLHGVIYVHSYSPTRDGILKMEEVFIEQLQELTENLADEALFDAFKSRHIEVQNSNLKNATTLSFEVSAAIANDDWDLEKLYAKKRILHKLTRRHVMRVANKMFGDGRYRNYAKVEIRPE